MKIAIAGATGFIGRNLLLTLKGNAQIELVALSRRLDPLMHNAVKDNILWRKCDGFNLSEVIEATKNCDLLIYLIHSMLPTASLVQGEFEDFDVVVADNFARAVSINNVKSIIYLGGLIPDFKMNKLSKHLASRLEVEDILKQYQNNLTTIRAGLVIGNNGSSYIILERLINRLPILLCPKWTKNKMQPIALSDLLEVFKYCLNNLELIKHKTFDIGSNSETSYHQLLSTTAKVFHKKRFLLQVPLLSPSLSKLWVTFITGISKELVFPLVESLEYEMLISKDRALTIPGLVYKNAEEALIQCQKDKDKQSHLLFPSQTVLSSSIHNVTSIQRLSYKIDVPAIAIAQKYTQWLNKKFKYVIKIQESANYISFVFLNFLTLLELKKPTEINNTEDNYIYSISKGLLVTRFSPLGTFEFRKVPSCKSFIIGIYNYSPSLPWFVYRLTQALIHLWVMKRFITWYQKHELENLN